MVVLLLSLLPEMTGPHNRKNGVLSVGMVHCLDTNVNFFKKGNICGRQEQFCRSRKIVVIHWCTLLCLNEKKQEHIFYCGLPSRFLLPRCLLLENFAILSLYSSTHGWSKSMSQYFSIFLTRVTVLTYDTKNLVLK